MKAILTIGAATLAFALQGCNRAEQEPAEAPAEAAAPAATGQMDSMPSAGSGSNAPAAGAQAGPYSTTGEVASVAGAAVTINHQPVEGLGWPAMSMTFQAQDPAMLQGLQAGSAVQFSFRQEGEQYVLTEIRPQ